MRTTQHRHACGRAFSALLILALSLGLAVPAYATPTNAAIEAARAKADEARQTADNLAADLEERTEEYEEIAASLQETRARISTTERELDAATAALGVAQGRLTDRAASIYRNGRVDYISVFVGVTDFQDFVTRIDLMRRIGNSDASIVASVKDAKERIEVARASLEQRKSEQMALRRSAEAKQVEVEAALAKQQAYVASLDSEVKRLVVAERERQERLARERAAAAAAAAARKPSGAGRPFDPSKLGPGASGAVTVALSFVGKVPYVWGGTTPDGFDCSGFTQYCYRQVGISIPRTSRQQFKVGAYIPPDRLDLLKPGDLVFFGRDGDAGRIHHVGMYIGDEKFVHAPQTGEYISISSLTGRIASRGDYVGATRP